MKELLEKIKEKEAVVGIVGMGYVGLPLAIAFAECGFRVVGYDPDIRKISNLREGQSYLNHVPAIEFADHVCTGRIFPTIEPGALSPCDAFIVCVPTPLSRNREPDLTCVVESACTLHDHVKKERLFILESTTYPGTTRDVFAKILLGGLDFKAGRDVYIAHSPERQDPGNPTYKTRNVPKVVGGLTEKCLRVAQTLYEQVIEFVVPVRNAETAEMVKVYENTYRLINIGWVNEMKVLCQKLGIDVWDVIDAAGTKPFGFQPFYPGPGVGGHCIPIDPFYLTWKAREAGMTTRFVELAGEINNSMPDYVIRRVSEALNTIGKAVMGSRVLVLGVTYKANVNDCRESPSFDIIGGLQKLGADVVFHDPHIRSIEWSGGTLTSQKLEEDLLQAADVVVVLVDHDDVDYELVVRHASLVVDTQNVIFLKRMPAERYFKA